MVVEMNLDVEDNESVSGGQGNVTGLKGYELERN